MARTNVVPDRPHPTKKGKTGRRPNRSLWFVIGSVISDAIILIHPFCFRPQGRLVAAGRAGHAFARHASELSRGSIGTPKPSPRLQDRHSEVRGHAFASRHRRGALLVP